MASTTFVDKVTVVNTDWLNDVNGVVWTLFGGTTTPSTARTALGLGTIATQNANAVNITGGSITNNTISAGTLVTTTIVDCAISGGTIEDLDIEDNVYFYSASDITKKFKFDLSSYPAATTATISPPGYTSSLANIPVGCLMDYAGSSVPTGWLSCDGSAVSRTTYSSLFAAISTTWGPGNGTTTFNLPDFRGRTTIGAGTAVFSETVTASSGNGFTVVSNVDGWLTGQAVVLSSLSGFTTSATAGPTYYIVRISSTNVRLATTLALAQNETPDVTISGSGSCVITWSATARTLGTRGGQDTKAMTITELLSHNHPLSNSGAGGSGGNFAVDYTSSTMVTGPKGGNAAMPMLPPYAAVTKIIRAL